jgi:CDP-L-myo-inositol myo-inositolphosphotransferase
VDPKPLQRVGGLALIERAIVTANRAGLTEFHVVTGYAADQLEPFLVDLAKRRGLPITAIRSEAWEAGNAASLLAARGQLTEPFALLMADHIFDDAILKSLLAGQPRDVDVVLACDYRVGSDGSVDEAEATKVRVVGDRIVAIGKALDTCDALDSGIFLCSPAIFAAAEATIRDGEASLSGAVGRLASQHRAVAYPVGRHAWIDVDTPHDRARAERLLSSRLAKPQDGWVARHLNRPLSRRVFTPLLLKLVPGVTPNQVSALSVGVAGSASLSFFLGLPALGGALVHLASVLDGSDGEIARLKRLESPFGGFLDSVLDRYGDSLILFGMSYFAWQAAADARLLGDAWTPLVLLVALLAIIGNFMVSYTSARAQADLGLRYRGQWVAAGRGRDLRLLVLALAGVLAFAYPISVLLGLAVVAVLTNAIVARRLVIASQLKDRGASIDAASLRAAVFDLDGTVADTMPFLTHIAAPLLSRHHAIPVAEAKRRYRDSSGVDFATQAAEMAPDHPANAALIAEFEAHKAAAIFVQPPFADALPTMQALRERGVRRFIVSSTPRGTVKAYARRYGLDSQVDGLDGFGAGRDKAGQLASILEEHGLSGPEVVFVGDSPRDRDIARMVGTQFVGVERDGVGWHDDVATVSNLAALIPLLDGANARS